MAALPIVVVQPGRQRLSAVARAGVGAAIRPLAQEGLDEALGLAICPRGVGARAEMAHPDTATETGEAGGDIAGAIVGQDAPDADAVAPKPGSGAPEKLLRGPPAFVRQHFDIGQPGGISIATCTYSQPMPRTRLRRSPLMRWPTRPMRPSFLTSRCSRAPGWAH
jgi:hypothetical protein